LKKRSRSIKQGSKRNHRSARRALSSGNKESKEKQFPSFLQKRRLGFNEAKGSVGERTRKNGRRNC